MQTDILILDFGSQYTQLIARRIRELGVYCEIYPWTLDDASIKKIAPKGIILSGGPESVRAAGSPRAPESVFTLGCPVLGICYGMQTMALQLGGQVDQGKKREYGAAKMTIQAASALLPLTKEPMDVWMSHGDHVSVLPPRFTLLAETDHTISMMGDASRHFYGLQFHPEVSHTAIGESLLREFVMTVCGCQPSWNTQNFLAEATDKIKKMVKEDHVILGLSGGLDSSVLAVLLQKTLGKQLTCVFVDNGLLRQGEVADVQALFAKQMGIQLITVNAEQRFLAALSGITDPEAKRKVIGELFVAIFEEEASNIKAAKWLAQGTIYPDVIESAAVGGATHVIKSHHNVGGLPETMQLQLLEPLRTLFKDEVKKLAIELGLPPTLIYRHPFPGPGLAVRVLGEVQKPFLATLRLADAILIEELHRQNLYEQCGQAFVVFLPVKSVGVLGDARHYDYVVAIRVVETIDFMTAHAMRLPYPFLETVANRIVNEVPGISRVVYDISSKPPATIEWE